MTVQTVVYEQIKAVAKQYDKKLPPLADHLNLLELGLDSLCIAVLVANLEDELGVDPLGSGDEFVVPVTVGDFVRVYENAVQ